MLQQEEENSSILSDGQARADLKKSKKLEIQDLKIQIIDFGSAPENNRISRDENAEKIEISEERILENYVQIETQSPKRSLKKPETKIDYFYGLDTLRVLLTFWIYIFHFASMGGLNGFGFATWITRGHFACELFFMLSGFLLTILYHKKFATDNWYEFSRQYAKFMITRFLRLWPLHAFTNYLFYHYEFTCSGTQFFHQLTMTQFLEPGSVITCNFPSWFVHQEFYACLFLPFVMNMVHRKKTGMLIATVFTIFFFLVHFGICIWSFGNPFFQSLFRMLPTVMLGLLIAYWYNRNTLKNYWHDILVLILIFTWGYVLNNSKISEIQFFIFGYALGTVIIYCVSKSVIFNFLSNNHTVKWFANMSFGIYIFQRFQLLWFWPVFKSIMSHDYFDEVFVILFLNFSLVLLFSITTFYLLEERMKASSQILGEYTDRVIDRFESPRI